MTIGKERKVARRYQLKNTGAAAPKFSVSWEKKVNGRYRIRRLADDEMTVPVVSWS